MASKAAKADAAAKPREKRDWRERKRLNAARAAAQREALAMVRVEPPPLPADDDEAGWRDLICSLPRFDPHAQADGAEFVPEAARDAIEWIQDNVTHLEGAKAGQNFVLERWQRAAVANAFGWIGPDGTRRFREVLIYVPKKAGKALDEDTPIPTPSGWRRMGDLVVGDQVFDERGRPCRVVAAGETQSGRPCFRVGFDDGTSIVADAEHEWYTDAYRTGRPGPQRGVPREQTKQTHADHIRTTARIRDTLTFRCGGPAGTASNHSIPTASPLRCGRRRLPIGPYTLGAWLGDGTSANAQITCASSDFEILDRIRAEGYEVGVPRFHKRPSPTTATVTLTPGTRGKRGTSALRSTLRECGLLRNKHIPAEYLRAAVEQRTELLRGLMDTDGYVSSAGQCEFTTTSPALCRGVVELVRSLGYKPNVKEGRARVNGRDVGAKWRISFWAYSDRSCFHLRRKAGRLRVPPDYRARSMRRQIVSVEPVPTRPVRCIQVDSPSHLYLAGTGMVPTHNSTLVMALTLYLFVRDDEMGAKVYCAAAAQKQARIIWDACKLQLSRIDPEEVVASRFQHSIVKPDGGFLKPIAADIKTEDGFNPHAFVLDELHRQPNAKLVNTARLSSKTRSQPMMIYLTTADEDRDSVCNDVWRRALRVLANGGDRDRPGWEPRFLPVVYQAEPEDDWTSPATWRKAAPSLGVTISEEDYAEECRLAREDPTLEADFKRYMLNLRTRTAVRAFDLAKWDACREDYDEQSLEQRGGAGPECIAGLDLSSTTDITALVLLFLGSGRTLSWFWVPEEAAKRRDKGNDPMYLRWGAPRPGKRPLLTLTEGDQLDERRVTADVVSILRRFRVREVGIDPYNALRYEQALQAAGLRVLEVEQNIRVQSEPLKKLSTMIGAREIRHDGNPVLRWMIGNAEVGKDHKDSWTLRKPKGADKVDGVAALVNAVARMLVQPAPRAAPRVRLL